MDIETKLKRFSDVVLKEADEIKKKQASLMDEKYDLTVNSFRSKSEAKYAEMLEEAIITAERQKQKRVAQKNADVKRALIQKRQSYIDSIFEGVQNRLEAFFKTPEYEQHLVDSIESAAGGLSGEGITVHIMRRDLPLKEAIEKRTGVTVLVTDEDFLGGVRVLLDKNRIADLTLKRRLEAEKSGFNKIRI